VPPKWLRRPVGASFGFSGKLVTFNNKNTINNTMTHSVKIIHVETDPEIVKRSEQLESASKLGVEQLIQDRIQTGDRKDWEAIKVLFSENAREELIKYLGFEKEQVMMTAQDLLNKSNMKPNETIHTEDLPAPNNTISTLFGSSETVSPDEVFFGQVAAKEQVTPVDEKPLAHVAPLVNRPFSLYPEGSTDADHLITRAIVLGDFESAVNVCLSSERYSDALLLAICGGSELLAKTQKTYFEKQSKKFTYLRLLEGILEEDLGSIVRDADLNEWSSVLAVLCTFSQTKDFGPLCEVFGDRLAQDAEMDQHATLFYLIAGNLEKVSKVWIDRFEKEDVEQGDSSTHGSRLQALIEKVTIFRQAIDYEDSALNNAEMKGDYPLSSLYDKYCEYAEFMATQGKLEVALKYISLTPSADPKSKISKSSIVRDRVYHANNSQSGQYTKPVFPFEKKQLSSKQGQQQPIILQNPHVQPNQQRHVGPPQPAMNLYAPVNVAQEPIHLYAPTHMTPAQQHQHHYSPYVLQNQHTNYSGAITDAYNNQQTQMYTQQHDLVPQQNYGPSVQQTALATPPPPPPPPSKSTGAWNDPPMLLSPKNNNKKKPQYVNADIVPTKRVTTPFAGNSPTSTAGSPQQQSNMHAPSPMNTTPPPPMRGLWGPSAPTAPPPPPSSGTTVGYYSAHQQPQQFQPPPQQTKATQLPPPPMNAVAPSPMRSFPAPPHQQQGF
jgi:protein transport protein SEC31